MRSKYGDVTLTSIRDDNGRLTGVRCDHADPRIGISPILMAQWHLEQAEWMRMIISLRCADTCPIGDVLTFTCANRRLVYCVTDMEPQWLEGPNPGVYIAEWPD